MIFQWTLLINIVFFLTISRLYRKMCVQKSSHVTGTNYLCWLVNALMNFCTWDRWLTCFLNWFGSQEALLAISTAISFLGMPLWPGTQYMCSRFSSATISTASIFLILFSDAMGYEIIALIVTWLSMYMLMFLMSFPTLSGFLTAKTSAWKLLQYFGSLRVAWELDPRHKSGLTPSAIFDPFV